MLKALDAMTVDDVKSFYGTQDKAAAAIGVSKQAVSLWGKQGKIPTDPQIAWEIDSKGKLRADLPVQIRRRAA